MKYFIFCSDNMGDGEYVIIHAEGIDAAYAYMDEHYSGLDWEHMGTGHTIVVLPE